MKPTLFETETIIDVTDDEPVRLCRMTFTADELHQVAMLVNVGARNVPGAGSDIPHHFYKAWLDLGIRASDGTD